MWFYWKALVSSRAGVWFDPPEYLEVACTCRAYDPSLASGNISQRDREVLFNNCLSLTLKHRILQLIPDNLPLSRGV